MTGLTLAPDPIGHNSLHIPLTKENILVLAEEYLDLPFWQGLSNGEADDRIEEKYQAVRHRGHMTADELQVTAWWKCRGNRLAGRLGQNAPNDVEEITRVSFACTSERLRIGALRALHGVDWPMASVILHFAFPDRFPILDVRVMHSMGGPHAYNFDRWTRVTDLCRSKIMKCGITMRQLDRALWTHDYKRSGQR